MVPASQEEDQEPQCSVPRLSLLAEFFFEKDACGDSDPLVRVGEYFSDVSVLTYQQG